MLVYGARPHIGATIYGSGDAAHPQPRRVVSGVSKQHFPVLWSARTAMVRLPAEIDLTVADDLREALLSVLNQGALALIADMTLTTFCDSAGITALIRAARRATANGAVMRLAAVAPQVLRVFALVGIDRLIDIYPSVDAALASLPDQRGGLVR